MATKDEVEAAKRDVELRRQKVQGWEVYFQFALGKIVGVLSTTDGVLELLDPDIVPIDTPQPGTVLVVGLTYLLGKNVLKFVSKAGNLLK